MSKPEPPIIKTKEELRKLVIDSTRLESLLDFTRSFLTALANFPSEPIFLETQNFFSMIETALNDDTLAPPQTLQGVLIQKDFTKMTTVEEWDAEITEAYELIETVSNNIEELARAARDLDDQLLKLQLYRQRTTAVLETLSKLEA